MTGDAAAGRPAGAVPWAGRAGGWLRASRGGLFAVALVVGAGSGLGAVAFRYLIYFFTWLATGHAQFGQQGRVGSAHFPGLGLGFFVVIPVIGGLIYGPLIYRYAREARGHGVPEVMIAVAEGGGRIRPQVAAVKSLASALCIGTGGSVGREGPIVQIGSALASSLGQWVKMPESRLRILVACGAAGGISATFNAPLTGVFFGVEIILREFSVEATFTVMLSAMIADLLSRQFAGSAPFLSGLPPGITLHHLTSYLLIAALAVIAALLGLAFAKILYATEDLCDKVWGNRPEWARPAAGGIALGLLLLALPQMYGVGYPVLYKAVGGSYALWFLIVLAAGKIIACSLTIGIGGSGGVFAPSLFIGATSGMAFGEIAGHLLGPAAGQPALYAVVAMGAVFASAARAPLTAVASVVEMTGDYTLTLPVMLAVAIATATSRALSYGTIYTTKLLRRGTDIDHPPSADPFEDLTAADAMHPFAAPLTLAAGPPGPGPDPAPLPGPITHRHHPQMLFASESPHPGAAPARALRPRRAAGDLRRRAAPARLDHQPERAPGGRPPHARRPRRPAGIPRRRPGRPHPAGRPRPAPGPAARLSDPGDHHLRRLARRRPGSRRHHLAARLDPGHDPGQPHPPRPRPRHHPGPRRPRQPARPRTTHPATRTLPRPARQPARRPPPRYAASRANAGSRIRRAAPAAGPRPDAAQQLAPPRARLPRPARAGAADRTAAAGPGKAGTNATQGRFAR
jgi:CIC family chloride channel protein